MYLVWFTLSFYTVVTGSSVASLCVVIHGGWDLQKVEATQSSVKVWFNTAVILTVY